MLPEFGNSSDVSVPAELPKLRIQFNPMTLPSGFVGLRDAGDFISALQLYLLRELAVHPRHDTNIAPQQAPVQTLLVVPEPGSVVDLVIPFVANLPHLYASIQPALIVVQRDPNAIGQVLLWAGKNLGAGALQAVGSLAARRIFDKHWEPDKAQLPPGNSASGLNRPSEPTQDDTYEVLREVAKDLEIATNMLVWLTRNQLSSSDPIFEDELTRQALRTMAATSNRPDFRQGSIAVSIPEDVVRKYDLQLDGTATFDHEARQVINHDLPQLRNREQQLEAPQELPEVVTGTVRGEPSYMQRNFSLTHPLYGTLMCHFGPDLIEQVSEQVVPDKKIMASGILHLQRKGRASYLEVSSIRPVQ